VAQRRDQLRALLNMVMNLGAPSYAENFLAIRGSASIPFHLVT
jgi:hypothetical protein